jgi:serine/threonine protein kinase
MAAICPSCGATNRPAAKFCMQCIAALPPVPAQPEQPFGDERTAVYNKPTQLLSDIEVRAGAVHALPEGTEIEGFRIVRQIGEGGFGIVYLAWDAALERHVAIKEYMPSSLAVRSTVSLEVSTRSAQHQETFDVGLRSFVNEARLLARFDHPALVKVFRYWEANGTAYMAMPYYEGPTLKTALARIGTPVPEELLREWLHPLLDALSAMHREQCYHRDISPDNILLTAAGPLLLDFGAARHVISDRTQALTTMLKPGFAPVEQYGGTMLQGAWTDLYALAGVMHYAIAGRPPPASVVRVVNDSLELLADTHAGLYGEAFLRAIDATLGVRPEDRPQDVAQFRALLDAEPRSMPTPPTAVEAEPLDDDEPFAPSSSTQMAALAEAPRAARRSNARYAMSAVAVLVAVGALWLGLRGANDAAPATAAMPAIAATPTPPPQAAAPTPASAPAPTPAPVATAPVQAAATSPVLPAAQPPAPAQAPRVAARKPQAVRVAEQAAPAVASVSETNRTLSREQQVASSYAQESRPPRCSDLVLKSSLDTLNPEEVAFQKTRCK